MAKSRYIDTQVTGSHLTTTVFPTYSRGYRQKDLFENVKTWEYVTVRGDRLDVLAAKHLGDDQMWWVLAYGNVINMPLDLPAGTVLKIPFDVSDVTRKLLKN